MNNLSTNYLTRRETHSSRALSAVVAAVVLIALIGYLAAELIAARLGYEALLTRAGNLGEKVANLPKLLESGSEVGGGVHTGGIWIALAGIGLILIALVLLGKALLPGALKRHAINDERIAYVVDDAVLAADMSRQLRRRNRLDKGQVLTRLSRRDVRVKFVPTSGKPLAASEVEPQVQAIVQEWQLQPQITPHIEIEKTGVVGR